MIGEPRLPVGAFRRWECGTPGLVDGIQSRIVDFVDVRACMEFVDTMMVVESDDWVFAPGFTVVEGILDGVWEFLGFWDGKYANPCNGAVGVGLDFIFEYGNVITHPQVLVQTLPP
jgi:hypothetical protein